MTVDDNIQQKANDIRMKIYGEQVRESLASGLEAMSSDVVENKNRQNEVETQFQQVIENTTDKDVISAPEIIAARNGEPNLKSRLDKEKQEVTAQLAQTTELIDLTVNEVEGLNNWLNDADRRISNKASLSDLASTNRQLTETKNELNQSIGNVADGTPLFASSISGMTNTSRLYVNTSDGMIYRYGGSGFVNTGRQYQSTGIANDSIKINMVDKSVKSKMMWQESMGQEFEWEIGSLSLNSGTPAESTTRIRSSFIRVRKGTSIYLNDYSAYKIRIYRYSLPNKSIISNGGSFSEEGVVDINEDCYIRILLAFKNDGVISGVGTIPEKLILGQPIINLESSNYNLTIPLNFERGGLNKATGHIQKSNVNDFNSAKRTPKFLKVTPSTNVTFNFSTNRFTLFEYSNNNFGLVKITTLTSNERYVLSGQTEYIKILCEVDDVEQLESTTCLVDFYSKSANPVWIKNNRVSSETFSFRYAVNSNSGRDVLESDPNIRQFTDDRYHTSGLLKLPENYDPFGDPVKLIIFSHGSADFYTRTAQEFSTNYMAYLNYLVDEGYALFDCYGWSTKYNINTGSQLATPDGMACLTNGYKWVVNNFNIDDTGVFLSGKSLGGLNAVNLCNNMGIPVLACAPLAPELNPIHIKLGYTRSTRLALADDFEFTGDTEGILGGSNVTADQNYREYIHMNANKMTGYIPLWNRLIGKDIETLVDYSIDIASGNELESNWTDSFRIFDVPIKIWIAEDDGSVSYKAARNFVKTIKNSGGIAELRTMPAGTGRHNAVDSHENALKVESIRTRLGIEHVNIPLAFVEMVHFFRRYEN